jgi:hypothetical protein
MRGLRFEAGAREVTTEGRKSITLNGTQSRSSCRELPDDRGHEESPGVGAAFAARELSGDARMRAGASEQAREQKT